MEGLLSDLYSNWDKTNRLLKSSTYAQNWAWLRGFNLKVSHENTKNTGKFKFNTYFFCSLPS